MTVEIFLAAILPAVLAVLAAIATFLTAVALWLRAKTTDKKLDENTALTKGVKDAADKQQNSLEKIDKQTNGGLESRLSAIEKNIASTRHEVRGHLQTLVTKLDLFALQAQMVWPDGGRRGTPAPPRLAPHTDPDPPPEGAA